jgi:hypothetical protein
MPLMDRISKLFFTKVSLMIYLNDFSSEKDDIVC